MIKQVLSFASLIFVGVCVIAIVGQFVNLEAVWSSFEHTYNFFDRDGEVEIVSMPAGAAIYINNKFIGQTPLKEKRAGGAYDVKLILDGYQTYARKITIDKKTPVIVHARLSKEYGVLHINSTPSNATVFLDGKRQGQLTPLELKVPLGKYRVKVVKDRFYTFEEEVMVESTSPTAIEADLMRQVGRLILETLPSGAKAYIGNDLLGTTPLTQDKPVGKYVITLKKSGFRDKVLEANIAPDESLEIHIEMAERSGTLKVTTNPPGAQVHINNVYQGETPIRVDKKPGVYQVSINQKGYRTIDEEMVIEDNITKNVRRDLEPILGELRIESSPKAEVWINGEYMGYTPVITNRAPGHYMVRAIRPGYENYEEPIMIGNDGASLRLKVELQKDQ
jgi:hypothetical protein